MNFALIKVVPHAVSAQGLQLLYIIHVTCCVIFSSRRATANSLPAAHEEFEHSLKLLSHWNMSHSLYSMMRGIHIHVYGYSQC